MLYIFILILVFAENFLPNRVPVNFFVSLSFPLHFHAYSAHFVCSNNCWYCTSWLKILFCLSYIRTLRALGNFVIIMNTKKIYHRTHWRKIEFDWKSVVLKKCASSNCASVRSFKRMLISFMTNIGLLLYAFHSARNSYL